MGLQLSTLKNGQGILSTHNNLTVDCPIAEIGQAGLV